VKSALIGIAAPPRAPASPPPYAVRWAVMIARLRGPLSGRR
jgi:hypothetical protein